MVSYQLFSRSPQPASWRLIPELGAVVSPKQHHINVLQLSNVP
jgi:hypothetical protein